MPLGILGATAAEGPWRFASHAPEETRIRQPNSKQCKDHVNAQGFVNDIKLKMGAVGVVV